MGQRQWVMGHSSDGSLGHGSLSLTHCLLWWWRHHSRPLGRVCFLL